MQENTELLLSWWWWWGGGRGVDPYWVLPPDINLPMLSMRSTGFVCSLRISDTAVPPILKHGRSVAVRFSTLKLYNISRNVISERSIYKKQHGKG
jgi:hypothetical protein